MLSWYMQRDRERPLMTPRVVTLAVRWYMTYLGDSEVSL